MKHMQRVADLPDAPPRSGEPVEAPLPALEGRRSRWTEHRRARKEELVGAAVEAVRSTGPDFAVDDVARSAGVSKTVIYRYFNDKEELIDAVLRQFSDAILLPRLLGELAEARPDDRSRLDRHCRSTGRRPDCAAIGLGMDEETVAVIGGSPWVASKGP